MILASFIEFQILVSHTFVSLNLTRKSWARSYDTPCVALDTMMRYRVTVGSSEDMKSQMKIIMQVHLNRNVTPGVR